MLSTYAILVAALSTSAIASLNGRAEFVPQIFDRATKPDGGWSLALNSLESCPTEAPGCGSSWCCPASLTCVATGNGDIGEVCCPGSIDCLSAFQGTPACADDTWSLWNATSDTADNAAYFCCLPGQSGMQDGTCVSSDEISSPTQLAVALGGGSSGTILPSSGSVSSSSSSATTTGSASAKSASTTAVSTSSSASKESVSTGSSTESATSKGSTTTESSGTTATSSASSTSSSAAATTKASAGDRNVVGAGVLGLAGVVGFAVGIL